MAGITKTWRNAATLLLAAKNTLQTTQQTERMNYKLLTMKRSSKSKFMPDSHVFPGGTVDKSDCSRDWLNLYKKFGVAENNFEVFKKVKYVAPIFKNDNETIIPNYISLRICAIREAFEECGVLLCRNSKQENNGNPSLWGSYFEGVDINEWQKRVHNDASQFIELCNKYEIYPDIWALHEWSNWLTPTIFKTRFDTFFFLASVPNIMPTYAEKNEVQIIEWDSPAELLEKNKDAKIVLPPPQFYELSRLMNFSTIEELAKFSKNRATCGTQRYLCQILTMEKMRITMLPGKKRLLPYKRWGDDMHPGEEKANILVNEVVHEVPEKNIVHRIYHTDIENRIVMKNYKHQIEHIYPLITNNTDSDKSKL